MAANLPNPADEPEAGDAGCETFYRDIAKICEVPAELVKKVIRDHICEGKNLGLPKWAVPVIVGAPGGDGGQGGGGGECMRIVDPGDLTTKSHTEELREALLRAGATP